MYNYRYPSYSSNSIPKFEQDMTTEVQQGLAVTPAQMLEMNESKIAISSFGLDYNEGTIDTYANHSDVPLERSRGIDVVDVWETQQNARYKFLRAKKTVNNNGSSANS
ncbi:hypothetical protein [Peromfec virus RodF8_14]|uniref:Uncharacterized protein n=1 Tax=Peromfec virus RodF8_14 TaxID=2929359 RepID=A0A976N2W5_9VIRU|nr:hypothetical protein [Peromfec virus RodF8_14]